MAHQRSLFVSVSALRNFLLFSCCVLLALGVMCAPAHAQGVSFAGVQTTVPSSGLLGPTGVAVDGAGDVFIVDPNNNQVVEIPAGGGAPTTVNTGGYTLTCP